MTPKSFLVTIEVSKCFECPAHREYQRGYRFCGYHEGADARQLYLENYIQITESCPGWDALQPKQ